MNLNQYPQAIAEASTLVNDLEYQISKIRRVIAEVEGRLDSQIAFGDFRNDQQRKATRFDVLTADSDYQDALSDLSQLNASKAKALVEVELLRNAYSTAKIEARMAIADKLLALESREIAGV
uniref:hypothetical protein n=1 Tax=Trichocoleus desertorum TaxID=1481672 RepID=UPI0025B4B667|nr:hypothetical protein [Trichocoleus desertorum]